MLKVLWIKEQAYRSIDQNHVYQNCFTFDRVMQEITGHYRAERFLRHSVINLLNGTRKTQSHKMSIVMLCGCRGKDHSTCVSGSVKVKVAGTRLPNVGFWSWSRFLAVSLQVTWVTNPAVGCHYFPPGPQLPLQPLRGLLPILLLGEQRNDGCEQFA